MTIGKNTWILFIVFAVVKFFLYRFYVIDYLSKVYNGVLTKKFIGCKKLLNIIHSYLNLENIAIEIIKPTLKHR